MEAVQGGRGGRGGQEVRLGGLMGFALRADGRGNSGSRARGG